MRKFWPSGLPSPLPSARWIFLLFFDDTLFQRFTTSLHAPLLVPSTLNLSKSSLLHLSAQLLPQIIYTLLTDASPLHRCFRILKILFARHFLQFCCGPTFFFFFSVPASLFFICVCATTKFAALCTLTVIRSSSWLTPSHCLNHPIIHEPVHRIFLLHVVFLNTLLRYNASRTSFSRPHLLYLSSYTLLQVESVGFAVNTAFITPFSTRRTSSSSSSYLPPSALLHPDIFPPLYPGKAFGTLMEY